MKHYSSVFENIDLDAFTARIQEAEKKRQAEFEEVIKKLNQIQVRLSLFNDGYTATFDKLRVAECWPSEEFKISTALSWQTSLPKLADKSLGFTTIDIDKPLRLTTIDVNKPYVKTPPRWAQTGIPRIGESVDVLDESASKVAKAFISSSFDDRIWELLKEHPRIVFPPFDWDAYCGEAAKELLETQIKLLAAKKLLEALQRVLASLVKGSTHEQIHLNHTNFLKNNKIPAPDDEDLQRVRERFPISIAEDLADLLDIHDKEMAKILTVSIRTYHRLKPVGLLNPVASERLLMLKDLTTYGVEVFEDQDKFNRWLRLPLSELSDNSPLDSLDTATGFTRVKTILGRIEYGIF